MRTSRALLAALVSLAAAGCLGWGDVDPFALSERTIAGRYRLKAWEDGSYYLLTPADTTDAFHGAPVQRLGWDRGHVVALRGPDEDGPGGWTVVEVATGRTRDRLTAAEVAADPAAARIPTFRADSAWARLAR